MLRDRLISALLAVETILAIQNERTVPGATAHWATLSIYVLLGFIVTVLVLARLRVSHGRSELLPEEILKLGLKATLLFLLIAVAVLAFVALLVGAGAGAFLATTKMSHDEAMKYAPYFGLAFVVPIMVITWWLYLLMALAFFTANGKALVARSLRVVSRNARVFFPALVLLCGWGLLKPVLHWIFPAADFPLRLVFAAADLYCYQLFVPVLMFNRLARLPETELA